MADGQHAHQDHRYRQSLPGTPEDSDKAACSCTFNCKHCGSYLSNHLLALFKMELPSDLFIDGFHFDAFAECFSDNIIEPTPPPPKQARL
jgi:hypothetical protein